MPSFESGNFKLEYAGTFPDQLKLIKAFEVFPLEITATGSLNPRSHKWSYSVGCRDVILNGKITYNATRSAVEYRKVLPFPVFGGITKPVLAAEWPVGGVDGWRDSWRRPRLQLGLSVDDTPSSNDDGATLTSNGSLAFRRKVFVTRRWGVEVDGDAKFSFSHDLANGQNMASALGLHVNAKELNLVCRI
uniref:Uncharacterized protein n=1 Tax=Tetradesmus obliquus TaxID=3088 RepID=A0A383VY41_TETOB|eukprot:jgi/Sobl393_1/2159/SZX70388.1